MKDVTYDHQGYIYLINKTIWTNIECIYNVAMVSIYIVKYYYNETIYFENVIYSCHGKADFFEVSEI